MADVETHPAIEGAVEGEFREVEKEFVADDRISVRAQPENGYIRSVCNPVTGTTF